jgi:hypothetical protein
MIILELWENSYHRLELIFSSSTCRLTKLGGGWQICTLEETKQEISIARSDWERLMVLGNDFAESRKTLRLEEVSAEESVWTYRLSA